MVILLAYFRISYSKCNYSAFFDPPWKLTLISNQLIKKNEKAHFRIHGCSDRIR